MVDLVYGRGITDIIREIPVYASIFKKFVGIKYFHGQRFILICDEECIKMWKAQN